MLVINDLTNRGWVKNKRFGCKSLPFKYIYNPLPKHFSYDYSTHYQSVTHICLNRCFNGSGSI
jgi:hypothetical protein